MFKDEDLCIHCGLCAERCPTAAWDMRRSELLIPYAGLEAGAGHPDRRPPGTGHSNGRPAGAAGHPNGRPVEAAR